MTKSLRSFFSRFLSLALAASITWASAPVGQALAATFNNGSTPVPVPSVPALGAALSGQNLALPQAGAALPTEAAPALAAPQTLPEAAAAAAAAPEAKSALAAEAPQAAPAEEKAPVLHVLSAGVESVGKAEGTSGRFAALKAFFTGSRRTSTDLSVAAPALETRSGALPTDIPGLEAFSMQPGMPIQARLMAVMAIAAFGGDQARGALDRLADWTGEDTVNGYKVRRGALAGLANVFQDLRSLPAVSPAQKAELLAELSARPPKLVASDNDDTLAGLKKPHSPEIADVLHRAQGRAEVAIITDRSDRDAKTPENGILNTLEQTPAELRAGLRVVSNKGLKLSRFDPAGTAQTVATLDVKWTDPERAAVAAGVAAVEAAFETLPYGNPPVTSRIDAASAVIFLNFMSAERVAAAAAAMQAKMAELGITQYEVVGRTPADPKNPPYVSVSKINKSVGMQHLRSLWSDPEGRDVVILGDQFMTQGAGRPTDAYMRDAAPAARVFAVGPTADPREGDIYLWDVKNAAGSREVLDAVATAPAAVPAPAQPKVNVPRFVAGLFAQRTISIIAFLLVAIAYPALATSMVGWSGYGVLMTVGNMTAIASGPLIGWLLTKFSKRDAMLINTGIRIALLAALPTFYVLGVLNFGTLLIAAMGEGYLLSSIVTTENVLVRAIVPEKGIQPVTDFLMMNFFGLQVIFGLILGIGHVADVVSPVVVYAIAAAANLLLVLPTILFTVPNLPPNPAKPGAARGSWAARTLSFFSKYRLEAGVFGAATAAFPLIYLFTPVPTLGALLMAASLVFWIARSDNAKALWHGDLDVSGAQTGRLRNAMLFLALGAFLFYPIQYFTLAKVSEVLAGGTGKGLLLGQLLGSLFLGNLLSLASRVNLPRLRLPKTGRSLNSNRLFQAGVVGLAFIWIITRAAPGNWLVAGAVSAAVAGLMALASRFTDRGWLQTLGVGFSSIWLPVLVWKFPALLPFLSVPLALSISMVLIGMFYSPGTASLFGYFARSARKETAGDAYAIQGSMFNAAISIGYALLTMASGLFDPAFPATLALLGSVFLAAGALYWLSPRWLPGLSPTLFKPRAKKA